MNTPIQYTPNFVADSDKVFSSLWNELSWLDVAGPRLEYYINDHNVPYTYGRGAGERTYSPQPMHPAVAAMRAQLEALTDTVFDVCFLNGYRDGKDALGWHADDSPEMDDECPIGIISLGAKREIYFRENAQPDSLTKVWLESGSLCLMLPGMQDTHQHKIPKSSVVNCGPRVSLTFRHYVKV